MEEKQNEEISNIINIPDANGNLKQYEMMGYINNESGNYIVYTDNNTDQNGRVVLFVNKIIKETDGIIFDEVTDEELQEVMNSLKERLVEDEKI